MMRIDRIALIGMVAMATAAGCDADCDQPSRIDGAYAVWSNISSSEAQIAAENVELYPFDLLFFNGWSEWDLMYIPSQDFFELSIDAQEFEGSFTQSANSCNEFDLAIQGSYLAHQEDATGAVVRDSKHTFNWMGQLRYFGAKIGGSWTYEDEWASTIDPDSRGTIVIPEGEMSANVRSASDTGF